MINVADQQAQLIEDLCFIEDVQERLSAVVQRHAKAALPPEDKVDTYRVPGCVSSVWLVPSLQDGACHFGFDAEFLAQAIRHGFVVADAPMPVKYFKEASSIGFMPSVRYGFVNLKAAWLFTLSRLGIRFKLFAPRAKA